MNTEEIRRRVYALREQIQRWDYEYFELDNPTVADAIYDECMLVLIRMEQQYSDLFTAEELSSSPSRRVGASSSNKFAKHPHSVPMLSLKKAYTWDDLLKYESHIRKTTGRTDITYWVEPKIDGLSISMLYKHGVLYRALTRGTGDIGEDITHNVLEIASIPKVIKLRKTIEIRGEVFVSLQNFQTITQQMLSSGIQPPANPRNLASGTLRQLDPLVVRARRLDAVFFAIVDPLARNIRTQEQMINTLAELGFKIPDGRHVSTLTQARQVLDDIYNMRERIDYQIDGGVIKLNELAYHSTVGQTANYPHHSIAFKYRESVVTTTVEDIFITIGRTGVVTYNARLTPVHISGSTVSAATLHNWHYVRDINLGIGDVVEVKKAGEIIPRVIRVAEKRSRGTHPIATHCPSCETMLAQREGLVDQFCPNLACPVQIMRRLVHFCSKDAMDINTLAERNINILYDLGYIRTYDDIYLLEGHKDTLVNIPGWGPRSVDIILSAISDSRSRPLQRLIYALGIEHVGRRAAKIIATRVGSFKQLLDYNFSLLANQRDIGPKICESLTNYFSHPIRRAEVLRLIELGIAPIASGIDDRQTLEYSNKIFVITGTHAIPRSQMIRIIEEHGGIVSSSISSKTHYLIHGDNPGSKLQRARDLGVELMSSDEFLTKFRVYTN